MSSHRPFSPSPSLLPSERLRLDCRSGSYTSPTNGQCPGYLQCNLVVLPSSYAFDFLLFCQRNPKPCPLLEVCTNGSSFPEGLCRSGSTADLKTDVPKYSIYRNGLLDLTDVPDVTSVWPVDCVSFLLGCSFTFESVLASNGISVRSIDEGKNVPMYRTNVQCRSAGPFEAELVVSMRPFKGCDVSKVVELTGRYPEAHGAPVHVGNNALSALGIVDIGKPDWGDEIDVKDDEVCVWHACGVTTQEAVRRSGVEFAITHCPGCMFVTDVAI